MADTYKLDVLNLPGDPLDARVAVLQSVIQHVVPQAVTFMRGEYSQAPLLEDCIKFTARDLLDASPCDLDTLGKIWFFPWAEACRELDQVQTASLLTMYKAAHDHLRRGMEMVIIGIYFALEETPAERAHAWISSAEGTPRFAQTVKRLIRLPHKGVSISFS